MIDSSTISALQELFVVAPMYTLPDICKLLRVSDDTVRQWVEAGKLKCVRLGRLCRFRAVDVNAFLSENGKDSLISDEIGNDDRSRPSSDKKERTKEKRIENNNNNKNVRACAYDTIIKRDYPTSTNEVLDAARTLGLEWNEELARAFLDYNAIRGWLTNGGVPIANWRAAMRRFVNKQLPNLRSVPQQERFGREKHYSNKI